MPRSLDRCANCRPGAAPFPLSLDPSTRSARGYRDGARRARGRVAVDPSSQSRRTVGNVAGGSPEAEESRTLEPEIEPSAHRGLSYVASLIVSTPARAIISTPTRSKECTCQEELRPRRPIIKGPLEKFVLSGCEVRCLGEKRFSRVLKGALSRSRGWIALAKECLRRRGAPACGRCALSPAMRAWPSARGRPIG